MSYTPQNAWNTTPQTGLATNPGPFLGEVMRNDDPLFSGRLLVYIPDMGGDPTQESSWHLCRYMSPFYGIQPLSNRLASQPAPAESLQSYGMWMTPPDLGVKVLVMFINGDRSRGVWIGCLPEYGSHGAVPGQDAGDFDLFTNYSSANQSIQDIPRPPHSTAPTFQSQGLGDDGLRGPITTSSLRESPSKVFGFNTPGSHSFVMDDGDQSGNNKLVRLRTAAGNQIMMNDDSGFVYIINAAGTGWIELSPSGHIDVYGESGINMATKGSINMHADQNINMHAGQNIKIVAQVGAKIQGTEEMQVHGGRLWLEGVNTIEQHSCGQIKLTGYNGMFFKSFDNFVLQGKCFRWNSGTALEAEQVPPEEPQTVSGYTTTVDRAPSNEPWDGHETTDASVSNSLGQTTGTPLSIPEGGSAEDLLPPGSPDTSDGFDLTPEQISLRERAFEGAGRRIVPGSYLDPERSRIVSTGVPVSVSPTGTSSETRTTRPTSVFSPETTSPPLTSRDPAAARPTPTVETSVDRSTSRPVSVFNPGSDSSADISSADPDLGAYLSETLGTPGGGFDAGAITAAGLPLPDPVAEASAAYGAIAGQVPMSSIPALPGGGNTGYFATGDNCARPAGGEGGSAIGPAGGGGAFTGAPSNVVPPAELINDPEWQAALADVREEFPQLQEDELYRIIQGESGFNSTIVNPDSGATGLFQFIPSTAEGLGTTTGAIQSMTPAQQLQVYQRYLRQSDYRGGPLGMIQAAPSTYRRLIREYGSWESVPRDVEVYSVGSAAWAQNPGWRDSNGRITIGGIESYYARQ